MQGSLWRSKIRVYGLLIPIFLGCFPASADDVQAHVPGRLLVGPRRDADSGTVRRVLALHRAVVRKQIFTINADILEIPEESSAAILQSLQNTGLFEYVERDYYAHTAAVPNDPSYSLQWHLPVLQLPQAWDITTGVASVVVAVIDSGVDPTHPDLALKLVPGWNFLNGSADTSDVLGHGTAVAGTVAASSNNGIGVAGVSWGSSIMPLTVVDSSDFAAYSNIAAAIQYAADHGVRIINVSIGGASASATLQNAVDYAWSKGAVVFAAAMNGASATPNYPAACNHVVAVSATDSGDRLASFSNYGNWITLAAPGAGILAPVLGGGYGYWYGTSFSAPVAAGVAALSLSVNPALTSDVLVDLLKRNADDLGAPGFDAFYGWGRINAYKTVVAAEQFAISVSVSPLTPTLSGGQTQQFTATVTNSTAGVVWSLSPASGTITSNGLYTAPAAVSTTQTVVVKAASLADITKSASAAITLQPQPGVSVSPAGASLGPGQTAKFTAAATNSPGPVEWSLSPAVGSISSTGLYTAPASVVSAQTVTLTAAIPGATAKALVSLVPPPVTAPVFKPIRINAGGPSYVDSQGQTWSADYGYTGGWTWSTPRAIAGTTAPALYQTQRYGSFGYQFAVPNGAYLVTLKFSEASQLGVGQRVFNVAINGASVLTSFDIYAQAGGFAALDKTFPVSVSNGQLNVAFTGTVNWGELNALQVVAGDASSSAFTPIRINAGGGDYTDSAGILWKADTGFSAGWTWSTPHAISNTTAPGLYQSQRYGPFTYNFAVPNGTYAVTLKFSETSQLGVGQRVFDVAINGAPALTSFDIFAQAGAGYVALDKTFPVTVSKGGIEIAFTTGAVNWPEINAIAIVAAGGAIGPPIAGAPGLVAPPRRGIGTLPVAGRQK